MKIPKNPFLAVALGSGLFVPTLHAAVTPYVSADADTSYLYHFNEAAGGSSAANGGSTGRAALSVDGNPYAGDTVDQPLITTVLGSTGFSGFGNAANVTSDACLGVDSDGNGGFRPGDFAPVGPDQMPNHSTLFGTGNAFTLEAMVNVPSITSGSRQIFCTDNNNAAVAERGFQFRISATGQLDFNFLGTTGTAAFIAPIPTTGPHAFAANQWFHLALTYTGSTMTYYWTRVDSGAVHANPIATNTVETVDLVDDAVLVIGNEGRATNGLGGEPLNGLIDEVRISEVERQATQFIFSDGDDLRDDWEVTYFRENESETLVDILAKFDGSDDPDEDSFDNLAEQTAGSNPTDPGSIPGNADGDGLDDAWEFLHFGDLDEVEGGDPDGDFATNEEEQPAETDPSGADGFLDFPDTEGGTGDGLSDAWEFAYFGNLDETADDDSDEDLYTHAEEYTLLTNPTDQLSAPDGDGDGLNDGWEALHFFVSGDDRPTLLARESGASDADSDGYSNDAEETAGTNPTTSQKPTDTDSDGLIDTWEIAHFESLDPLPGDLTGDGDAFSNLQEQNAGSNPEDTASVPSDIDGDSTADTAEAFQPYSVDSNTLHLWHLDEMDQPAADAVSGGLTMTALSANGRMWTPSLAGFGTALDPSLGRGTAAGGVLSALPPSNTASDNTTLTYAGVDGAFTFEAIVRIDFDPSIAPPNMIPMQIVTGEAEDSPNRVWQLRLVPIGGPGNVAGTTPLLEFINLHGDVGVQSLSAPLPLTADPDAIAQNGWYHVAVAYNGSEATAGNIKLYWTLLDSARTEANELFSGQMTNDLITAAPDFTIGNEGRDFNGTGSTDSFLGVVDEVRISNIARTPSQFHFVSTEVADNLGDTWEMTYFGDLDETDTGDFDSDGTDNLTEFRLGLIPNSGTSRFAAVTTDGNPDDGFTLTWPSLAGTSFNIWRSYDLAGWTEIASDVTASPAPATSTSHTDATPVPPDKKAFYRVELVSP
ncbi:MAG: LamG-like jellyroll fold domain-containing protein [Verrucomicrobiota bacterium]